MFKWLLNSASVFEFHMPAFLLTPPSLFPNTHSRSLINPCVLMFSEFVYVLMPDSVCAADCSEIFGRRWRAPSAI